MDPIVLYSGAETYFHSFLASGLAWGRWSRLLPVYLHSRSPQYLLNGWLGVPHLPVWMFCTKDKF